MKVGGVRKATTITAGSCARPRAACEEARRLGAARREERGLAMVEEFRRGMTVRDVATLFGVHIKTVEDAIRKQVRSFR